MARSHGRTTFRDFTHRHELEPLRVCDHSPLFHAHRLFADFRLRDAVNAPVFERPVIHPLRATGFFQSVIFRLAP